MQADKEPNSRDRATASISHDDEPHSSGRQPTFPERLMSVLSNERLSDIITWLPNGKSWCIHDTKRFESEVMPNYFGKANCKYSSFKRRLNRWEFHRVSSGIEKGAYYHPLFRRGDQKLCAQMKFSRYHEEPHHPSALALATPQMAELVMVASMAGRDTPFGDGDARQLHIPRDNATEGQTTEPGYRNVPLPNELEPRHLPNPFPSSQVSQVHPSLAPLTPSRLLHHHLDFLKKGQSLQRSQEEHQQQVECSRVEDYQIPSLPSRQSSSGSIFESP